MLNRALSLVAAMALVACGVAPVDQAAQAQVGAPRDGARPLPPLRALVPAVTEAGRGRCGAVPIGGRPALMRGHEVRFAQRLSDIEAALGGPKADVLMVGDSITQQWPDDLLASAFPGRRVLNAGVSGDTTGALLARLAGQKVVGAVDGDRRDLGVSGWSKQAPKLVVLLIGTNDLRLSDTCNVEQGILAAARRLGALYPAARIAVIGLLPRGVDGRDQATTITAVDRQLARDVPALGSRYGYIDASAAVACPGTSDCGLRRPPTYVHLTPEGYRRYAALLREKLAVR